MPILDTTREDKIELSYRLSSVPSLLPKNTPLSHLPSSNLPPFFRQRLAAGYTSLGAEKTKLTRKGLIIHP